MYTTNLKIHLSSFHGTITATNPHRNEAHDGDSIMSLIKRKMHLYNKDHCIDYLNILYHFIDTTILQILSFCASLN